MFNFDRSVNAEVVGFRGSTQPTGRNPTGGHLDSYYEYAYDKLNKIQKDFNKGDLKRSDLMSEVERVENEVRKDLMNRERKAMLQENDPHHR